METIIFLSLIFIISFSCTPERDKIDYSIEKLKLALKNNDQKGFDSLILNQLPSMPKDNHYELLLSLYSNSELALNGENDYTVLNEVNRFGQKVIKLPYYVGLDSITAVESLNLLLYYGPKEYFPMDKFSHFETEIFYDKDLLKQIYSEKLKIDFD
ncbi:MAG: hypothetical protein LAT51_04400 [Flavobacteriaceae bacterium]|nr:hypothetical protein [Flavobacteriaceae bacterium]